MAFELNQAVEGVLAKSLKLIVAFALIGGVIATIFTNVKTVVTAFSNTSATGNSVADALVPVFGIVVALGAVFAIVKLLQSVTE